MLRKTHHVVPNLKGGWNMKKGGSDPYSGHFDTKIKVEGSLQKSTQGSRNYRFSLSRFKTYLCQSLGNERWELEGSSASAGSCGY